MTDRATGSSATPARAARRETPADPASSREYSARLAALGRFTVRHKALTIGVWIGAAIVLIRNQP